MPEVLGHARQLKHSHVSMFRAAGVANVAHAARETQKVHLTTLGGRQWKQSGSQEACMELVRSGDPQAVNP